MIRGRQTIHSAGRSQSLNRTDEFRAMRHGIAISTGVRAARWHH
jgi:hypothetical protein